MNSSKKQFPLPVEILLMLAWKIRRDYGRIERQVYTSLQPEMNYYSCEGDFVFTEILLNNSHLSAQNKVIFSKVRLSL